MSKLSRSLLGLSLLLLASAPARALTESELNTRMVTRIDGDRSGACIVVAVVEEKQVLRGRRCAKTRPEGAPSYDAAFEIGSISKTMTAFLVADLVESGRWSLDDPIAKHLPPGTEVPRQGERQILVRDLLSHSSMLPAQPTRYSPADIKNPYAGMTEQDLWISLADPLPAGAIGSRVVYSNFGTMVLSMAVARAYQTEYGGDLERALKARLFDPLKMDGAFIAHPPKGVQLTQGHLPTGEPTPPWTWDKAPNAAGVGGVRARLADMVRYAQAHLGLIKTPLEARLRKTQAPLAMNFGMNWIRVTRDGHDLVLHEGATGGFAALMLMEPERKRAVIVLSDTAIGELGPFGLSLLDDSVSVPRARLDKPVPATLRAQMVGDFSLPGLKLRLWDQNGRLMLQAEGQQALELQYDDKGELYPANGLNVVLTPVVEDGVVRRFTWRQGGGVAEALRVDADKPLVAINPAWKPLVGEYRLADDFRVRIFEDAGHLMVQGTGQPSLSAVLKDDKLEVAQVGAVIEFQRNDKGEVIGIVLNQRGESLPGTRQPAR